MIQYRMMSHTAGEFHRVCVTLNLRSAASASQLCDEREPLTSVTLLHCTTATFLTIHTPTVPLRPHATTCVWFYPKEGAALASHPTMTSTNAQTHARRHTFALHHHIESQRMHPVRLFLNQAPSNGTTLHSLRCPVVRFDCNAFLLAMHITG